MRFEKKIIYSKKYERPELPLDAAPSGDLSLDDDEEFKQLVEALNSDRCTVKRLPERRKAARELIRCARVLARELKMDVQISKSADCVECYFRNSKGLFHHEPKRHLTYMMHISNTFTIVPYFADGDINKYILIFTVYTGDTYLDGKNISEYPDEFFV